MEWSPDEVLAAVRTTLRGGRLSSAFERADLDGDYVLVVFRIGVQRYGVRYSLADRPTGPNTGERCDTPEEWAREVGWDIDEQVDTGGVARVERVRGADGLVFLRWRG